MSAQLLQDIINYSLRNGADAADVVFFESTDISASCRLGEPEELERAESIGLGLRVFAGDKNALVSSSSLKKSDLEEMATRAIAMAKASTDDECRTLAPEDLLARKTEELDLYDVKEPSVEWLQEQSKICEDAARAHKGITNSEGAAAHYSANTIYIAASNGFSGTYKTSSSSISVSVIAEEDGKMEGDSSYSSARYVADLESTKLIGDEAAQRTIKRLNPKKIKTAKMPVVFDPRVGKSLIGNFAASINGTSIARGTSFLKNDLGKLIFNKNINIIDNPHIKRGLSSRPYDGEGVQNKKMHLIENGELKTWLLDMRSANQLGLRATGHAARSISSHPSPASSNLYMENGKMSVKELLSDIKNGFYVTETFGMGINLVTGDYSQGASGFRIENGEVTYAVSEVTIASNLREMFQNLTPANDLKFKYSTNAPTIRVEEMMVAGA